MASPQGLLPASKEVVLEIQLNKLIHDFLFSGVGGGNTSSTCNGDVEGENATCIVDNQSPNVDAKPRKMDHSLSLSFENAHLSENAGYLANTVGTKESDIVPGIGDDQNSSMWVSNIHDGCHGMPFDCNNNICPTAEEVRLDMHDQTSNLSDVNAPQPASKVKVFRLSKSHSVGRSLFCFSMQRQDEIKEKGGKGRAAGAGLKLTRIGSLPCHSKLHNEAEKGSNHTCKKPPRPPRSPLEKSSDNMLSRQVTSDAVLVLHGTSKRARLERRKRQAGASSSNASIWALIFTLLFALAMLGEGFWSQNSAMIASNSSISSRIDTTIANSNTKPSPGMSFQGRTVESGTFVSSQLEKEMQMRKFWMSKALDPT